MRAIRALAFFGLVFVAPIGMAQSVFDGTWRPDPQKPSATRAPDVFELANGLYDCQSCKPPYKIKADGLDQPIAGNPNYDTLSVAVIDDRTIMKTAKNSGKTVMEMKAVVSADGNSETEQRTMYGMGPHPIELTSKSSRVSAGPQGSHRLSGGWQLIETDLTNHDEDTTYKISGDTLTMSDRMGRSFVAKLDGTDAPYKGDPKFTSVSVKMIDSRTIEESDKNGSNVTKIARWSVEPDGKTMHVRFDNTQGKIQEQTGHKME